jgi:multimeric flavodoxin WrbA
MLRQVMTQARKLGAEVETILLREKHIQLCDGCLSCELGGESRKGECRLKDDMQEIYPRLLQADAVVFATPVYFEMVSGLLKNFMDRTCPIWTRLEGKLVAGIAVAEEGIGKALENIQTYCSVCKMRYIGGVTALGRDPRDVSRDKAVLKQLQALGRELVNSLQRMLQQG